MEQLINGKTPEQIRAALILCTSVDGGCGKYECAYKHDGDCSGSVMKDALALIEDFEARLIRREELLQVMGVKVLDQVKPKKWTRVKDGLPKPFVSVQVYMPGEAPHPTVREGFLTDKGVWHAGLYDREPDEVTHWTEMEKPPEEGA